MTQPDSAALTLSAVLITRNEAHRIERCLESVAFADEIVVLDSGSTDGTVELARARGARVKVDPHWPGFGPQKNRALALARGRWVLSIDADEVVTPELRDAILQVVAQDAAIGPEHDAAGGGMPGNATSGGTASGGLVPGWWVRRRSTWCGQPIRHGDWRNDRVLRLFRRELARFTDDPVHERVLCPEPHGQLDGWMLHDSVDTPEDGRAKMLRYARLGAQKLRARGRGGLWPACTHAAWTFLRGYLVRGGFLDGAAGLAIAATNARGTFLRYRWAGMPESGVPAAHDAPAAGGPQGTEPRHRGDETT